MRICTTLEWMVGSNMFDYNRDIYSQDSLRFAKFVCREKAYNEKWDSIRH